jgi:hypothetical protein
VGDKLKAGLTKDSAAADAAIAGMGGQSGDLANILGGSLAAGDLKAAGVDEVGSLSELKQLGAQGGTELAAAIAAEGASQSSRESVRGRNALTDATNALGDTRARAAATELAARMQAEQTNNQSRQGNWENTLKVKDYNNQVGQQGYQNQVAKIQALEAAATAGLNIDMAHANGGTKPLTTAQRLAEQRKVALHREETMKQITQVLGATNKHGMSQVKGAANAVSKAAFIAQNAGLDLRKPEVQQLFKAAIANSVHGYNPVVYEPLYKPYFK